MTKHSSVIILKTSQRVSFLKRNQERKQYASLFLFSFSNHDLWIFYLAVARNDNFSNIAKDAVAHNWAHFLTNVVKWPLSHISTTKAQKIKTDKYFYDK